MQLKAERGVWITSLVLATFLALAVGIFIGTTADGGPATMKQAVSQPESTFTAPAAPAEPTTTAQLPADGFPGDGTFLIGQDIQPGKYQTQGMTDGAYMDCTWTFLEDLDPNTEETMGLYDGSAEGPATVKITEQYVAFKSSNCQPWKRRSQ